MSTTSRTLREQMNDLMIETELSRETLERLAYEILFAHMEAVRKNGGTISVIGAEIVSPRLVVLSPQEVAKIVPTELLVKLQLPTADPGALLVFIKKNENVAQVGMQVWRNPHKAKE